VFYFWPDGDRVNEPTLSIGALSRVPYQVEGALTKSRNNLTRDAADRTMGSPQRDGSRATTQTATPIGGY